MSRGKGRRNRRGRSRVGRQVEVDKKGETRSTWVQSKRSIREVAGSIRGSGEVKTPTKRKIYQTQDLDPVWRILNGGLILSYSLELSLKALITLKGGVHANEHDLVKLMKELEDKDYGKRLREWMEKIWEEEKAKWNIRPERKLGEVIKEHAKIFTRTRYMQEAPRKGGMNWKEAISWVEDFGRIKHELEALFQTTWIPLLSADLIGESEQSTRDGIERQRDLERRLLEDGWSREAIERVRKEGQRIFRVRNSTEGSEAASQDITPRAP